MLYSFNRNISFLLTLVCIIFIIPSCQKNEVLELKLFDTFLQQNHTFNTKRLNLEKATHFDKAKEIPEIRPEACEKFEIRYEQIIAKLEELIIAKESTIDAVFEIYNQFIEDVKDVLYPYYKKEFGNYIQQIDPLNLDPKYRLKVMKNHLTLAMMYAYRSFNGNILIEHTGGPVRVRTTVAQDKHQTKIILVSKYLQDYRQQKEIVVDKIVFKGVEKKFDYEIVPNYAFADIFLDSLAAGNYTIEGTVQYLDREGTSIIPFQEEFSIDSSQRK
ncbi:MAG: hypothetical protein AAF611_22055 [Bacteroidota bacterium]